MLESKSGLLHNFIAFQLVAVVLMPWWKVTSLMEAAPAVKEKIN
jgi:hypothetical protein